MDKPGTSDTRGLLLQYGAQIAMRSGLRGLTVRGLCQEAGVNPGSFVYHFGSRNEFLAELIERGYAPLFQQIQSEFAHAGRPIERLRRMLLQLARFLAGRGGMASRILMDGFSGEPVVVEFLRSLGMRHPQLLLRCIVEAQQAGEIAPGEPEHVMMFLMSSVGLPVVLHGLIQDKTVLPDLIHDALSRFAADPP
ncbi:MAG TPA: TetR/AcrR family transcriptional regulator, partial [Burkholderiaceae bacterium]